MLYEVITDISRNFLVPGSISVVMTIIGALLTSLVVAREWERGTMEALLATPVTRTELLLSKILPYYVLGMLASWLCLVITSYSIHYTKLYETGCVLFGLGSPPAAI